MSELEKLQALTVTLSVKKGNTRARKLYEKEGFLRSSPEVLENFMPDMFYEYQLDITPDNLPQGNIIQRYKKISMVLLATGLGALLWRKFRK